MVRRVSSRLQNVRLRTMRIGRRARGDANQKARQYGIRATPTTVILRESGAVATKLTGVVPSEKLRAAIERSRG